MHASPPPYNQEENDRRGKLIYDSQVRPVVEAAHQGEFVAIDIETGAYLLDRDDYAATEHLLARHPESQVWLVRVGYPAAYRLGGPRSAAKRDAA